MSDINITVSGTKRLLTAGKRHISDIVVTAEGGDDHYDAFWDMFQENGNRTDYRYAFAYTKWNDRMFKPKYPLKFVGEATYVFVGTEVVWADKVLQVDLSEATNMTWLFRNSKFTKLGKCDFSAATDINGIFSICNNLESIEEVVSNENLAWSNAFGYSSRLRNITFSGVIGKSINFMDCSQLTAASVQSIIDHLKDLSGLTAQTLTFHQNVGGKLTDEQKAAITAKNWTLVY